MPPKIKITRDDILDAALELVRQEGEEGLTTRAIAQRLNCSTQPIFSNFPNMEALHRAVLEKIYEIYVERTFRSMQSGEYPPYKASGMAYILFAVEEPQLFRMLYMRDRRGEEIIDDTAESEQIVAAMMKANGLGSDSAHSMHTLLWVVVHGLAVMYATGYEKYDQEKVSSMLSDVYQGVLARLKSNENANHKEGN